MSQVIFNNRIDMIATAATPSSGGYTIGYDTDGVLKQKDSLGAVTPLFMSSTQNLRQTLNVGNDSGIYSIMMGTGTSIYSANSTNRIWLGYSGDIFMHSVAAASGTSSMRISDGYIEIFNSTQSSYGRVLVSSGSYSVQSGSHTQSVILSQGQDRLWLTLIDTDAAESSIVPIDFGSSYEGDTSRNKAYVHINSKDADTLSGVENSVVIGGSYLTASVSDTVYLGNNVNINNKYTLPSTDGLNGEYMRTDGLGNVSWQNFVPTTPSLSLVLSAGNNSESQSLVMGTGTSIASANGESGIYLDEGGSIGKILISTDSATKAKAYLQLSNDVINISATSGNITIGDKKGLQYSENYSATFVSNSLVSKQYVDSQLNNIYLAEKIAYVDPVNGSDVSGLVNRVDKPFSTVAAATLGLTTSAVFTPTQPGLIHLKKGSYNMSVYLQDNINYYCEPDVVFVGQGFTDLNGVANSNIYGFARFVGTNAGASSLVPLDVTKASTINFQFLRIESYSVAFKIGNTSGTSNVSISGDYVNSRSNIGSAIFIGDNSSSVRSNVRINIRERIVGGYNALDVKPQFIGSVEVNCPVIECNSVNGPAGSQADAQHAVIVRSASASVSITGNLIESSLLYGGGNNSALYVTAGTVSVSGSISGGKCPSVLLDGSSLATVKIKGDISSEREAIINTSTSIRLKVDGSVIKTSGSGTVPYPIHINSGSASSTYLNSVIIYNALPNSGSILLSSTSSTIGIYNSFGYGLGTTSGNFIYCSASASVGIHNTRSNKDNAPTITDTFSPSGFTYDQNLYLGDF